MNFEHGVRITTDLEPDQVRDFAVEQFGRVGTVGELRGELVIRKIQATFGSIQRYDASRLEVRCVSDGVMVVVRTLCQPSIPFCIFVGLGLFAYALPALIPVAIYLYHKGLVQNAIKDTLSRIESEMRSPSPALAVQSSTADEISKLARLRSEGLLTDDEFDASKRHLLGPGRT